MATVPSSPDRYFAAGTASPDRNFAAATALMPRNDPIHDKSRWSIGLDWANP
jgi:hypothetical protein